MFGKPASEVWGMLWEGGLKALARKCMLGDSVYHHNDLLLYAKNERGNFIERYHTWSYVPIRDGDKIVGLYNMSLDTTAHVLFDRRFDTARELVDELAFAHSKTRFFEAITDALDANPIDAPFAICYSVDALGGTPAPQLNAVDLTLQSTVGVPAGHSGAPARLHVPLPNRDATVLAHSRLSLSPGLNNADTPMLRQDGPDGFQTSHERGAWPIAQALTTRQCVLVDDCSELVKGMPIRQWDTLPDQAVVIPVISDSASGIPQAVVILGLNFHSSFDDHYARWINTIRGYLVSSLSSINTFESEVTHRLERERLARAQNAWFRGAAHEFRTPLTLIMGPLDDVMLTDLRPSQRHTLGLAQRNVQRLQRLVTMLLDFTRIETGRLTARFVPGDLGLFIINIANLFRPAIERLKLEFTLDVQPRDERVDYDPVLLEMAVSGLLSNALKYTQNGTVAVTVTFSDDSASIAVSDTGQGIASPEMEKVTELYHRSSAAVQSGVSGTGIGLALAKEILRLHNGELQIESTTSDESHGSTFTVIIPLHQGRGITATDEEISAIPFGAYGRQAAKEALMSARESDAYPFDGDGDTPTSVMSNVTSPMSLDVASNRGSSSSDGIRSASGSGSGMLTEALMFEPNDRVLVVDDNRELRDYIKSIFTPFCTVLEAANGKDALEIMRIFKPHVVISDLLMPGMSGTELLNTVRSDDDPALRYTPMVLLSAIIDDETRLETLVAGAEDYITKPFKRGELIVRVHLHMQMGKKRAKLEALFAEREKEIAVLSDYCPSGIIRISPAGQLTYANAAFRKSAGMGPATNELSDSLWSLGRNYCDPDTAARLECVFNRMLSSDETTTTVQWKWLTGRTMSAVFIRLDDERSGIVGCITDITYQEERLLEAERLRVLAEESKHQQELLVDFTSHEIRTPVSAILQCSSVVKENLTVLMQELQEAVTSQRGYLPTKKLLVDMEEDLQALESIYQCGLVQERIAGDVLSLARIQLDMLTMHDVPMDIREEGTKALSVFASEARMKNADIDIVFGPTLDALGVPAINTDPVRLGQVIGNLVANALRFISFVDERRITVAFDVAFSPPLQGAAIPSTLANPPKMAPPEPHTPVYLFVSVRDTGPGMPAEEKDALFQRFHQGNKMIHTRYGGSGLGLFICKKVTELLGGRIDVVSEVGKGSEFRFFIRATTAAASDARAQSAAWTAILPPAPMAGPLHILVVEDNIMNQTILKRQIVKSGLTCDTANNGQEALDLLGITDGSGDALGLTTAAGNSSPSLSPRGGCKTLEPSTKPYDVVLMDLEMPIMDGLTAVRHIRVAQAGRAVEERQLVIALTGNARQGQIDLALEAGMDDVVIKPYRLPALLETIQSAVATRRSGLEITPKSRPRTSSSLSPKRSPKRPPLVARPRP
ncbi:hypothetical protein Q8F55_008648 [Vanrija albida]|uniref:Histidine kinase n=1 Tax=Vanrija albida TaxID=181172 RepID=A0ABR3PRE0_9TREE